MNSGFLFSDIGAYLFEYSDTDVNIVGKIDSESKIKLISETLSDFGCPIVRKKEKYLDFNTKFQKIPQWMDIYHLKFIFDIEDYDDSVFMYMEDCEPLLPECACDSLVENAVFKEIEELALKTFKKPIFDDSLHQFFKTVKTILQNHRSIWEIKGLTDDFENFIRKYYFFIGDKGYNYSHILNFPIEKIEFI